MPDDVLSPQTHWFCYTQSSKPFRFYLHFSIRSVTSWNCLCDLVVRVPGYRSRGAEFDSRRYQILWQVVGLKRGPLSLVITTEELLGRNNSGSSLESRAYDYGYLLRWPRDTLYPQKWALTSAISGGRSVGMVRSRTKASCSVRRLLVCCIPYLFLLQYVYKAITSQINTPEAKRARATQPPPLQNNTKFLTYCF
jgi:hypothetical protein